MRRFGTLTIVALIAVLAVSLTTWTFAQARANDYMMVGIVVAEENVALELEEDQMGTEGTISVSRVLAPDDSWLVVHLDDDGMPGMRIGVLAVPEGESSDVVIELDEMVTTPNVIVALHADRGKAGEFEFDMDHFMESPDKPYFVDFHEVAAVVSVSEFGIPAEEGEAVLEIGEGALDDDELMVDRVVAPGDAWVVVHLEEDGMPGMRVGIERVGAGETLDVAVMLDDDAMMADRLIVALHADLGVSGEFEFDMDDKVGSPDQPYFIDGEEVAVVVEE